MLAMNLFCVICFGVFTPLVINIIGHQSRCGDKSEGGKEVLAHPLFCLTVEGVKGHEELMGFVRVFDAPAVVVQLAQIRNYEG